MTSITKNGWNLAICGEWIHNVGDDNRQTFVARCRMRGEAKDFARFLANNFTPAEYFARLDLTGEAGRDGLPLPILSSKGYVQPHIRKWLRDAGLPQTSEGYRAFIARRS